MSDKEKAGSGANRTCPEVTSFKQSINTKNATAVQDLNDGGAR